MAKISKKKIPTFTINGKTYIARELDFNAIADLEDAGLSLSKLARASDDSGESISFPVYGK